MTMATLIKEHILIGAGLQFRDSVHCHLGRKSGVTQADMVLEKWLRVLHLDLRAVGRNSEPLGLA